MAPAGAVFYGVYDWLKHNHLEHLRQQAVQQAAARGERLDTAAAAASNVVMDPVHTLLFGALAGGLCTLWAGWGRPGLGAPCVTLLFGHWQVCLASWAGGRRRTVGEGSVLTFMAGALARGSWVKAASWLGNGSLGARLAA